MKLIEERDKRTVRRKIAKKEWDEMITLSVNDTQTVRLLDEGAVVMANGNIDFYIQKGTLEKFLNDLEEDYVGTINVGHMDFASFPFILGTWTKKDLHLVDIGDGRKGLDVDLHLDYENPLVKSLAMMPYSLGVSAEFYVHVNEEASNRIGVEVIDDVFIHDFAIVGEAGNVNSSGIKLKGGTKVTLKELTEKLGVTESEVLDAVDESIEKEEAVEPEVEAEELDKTETEELSVEETVVEDEVEEKELEATEEVVEDETDKMLSVMSDVIEKLSAKVDTLTSQVYDLTAQLEQKDKELAVKDEKAKSFGDKFKHLYASLAEDEPVVETKKEVLRTDGIGEL